MAATWEILAGTVTTRPYVFAFFAAYLMAAVPHLGWRNVSIFTLIGYLTAFASELCSINTGFPYGWYYYIDKTSSHELWIAGVPFFDSLSYVFLCYCSYSVALFLLSPLKREKLEVIPLETVRIRKSFAALLLGSLLQTYLDIIIDPVALQGSRWFLGQIYGYRGTGIHFGVPISNYLGWWLTSAIMIFLLQRLAALPAKTAKPAGVCSFPFSYLLGPGLYLGVIVFNITIAILINEATIAVTGIFITLLPLCMTAVLAVRRINRYQREELAEHLRDYPWSPAAARQK